MVNKNGMSVQTFYGKGAHRLLLAGSRDARGKIKMTKTGIPNGLNFCINFYVM